MSDESSVTINPEKMGRLGRLRSRQALRRQKGRAVPDAGRDAFRAVCPWCQAPNLITSEIAPDLPRSRPPDKGDVVQCDACRKFHGVVRVEGFNVHTARVDVDTGA